MNSDEARKAYWKKFTEEMLAEWDELDAKAERVAKNEMRQDLFGLASKLYAARIERKLTQAQLAEKSGVPRVVVTRLESGKANPSYKTLLRVVRALDYEVALVREESVKS